MTTLASELTRLDYNRLFLSDDRDLDRLWSAPGGPAQLGRMMTDAGTPAAARFLAAEIVARREPAAFPPADDVAVVAAAYADALAGTVEANRWGMPGELDEPAGQHLVALGKAAVPALRPLLTDGRTVIYAGSKEAMVGNEYNYRVKDLAAFMIARITGLSYRVVEDPAARDRAISELAARLGP